jgi:Iron-sulfur binding domain of endonuclease III
MNLDGYYPLKPKVMEMKRRNFILTAVRATKTLPKPPAGKPPNPWTEAEVRVLPSAPQDRQRRAQHGLRRAHPGCRHPCVSGRQRTGLAPGKTPLDVELGLEKVIPVEFRLHAHHWLVLHGRYTCLARKPRCEVCLINDLCRWPEKTI